MVAQNNNQHDELHGVDGLALSYDSFTGNWLSFHAPFVDEAGRRDYGFWQLHFHCASNWTEAGMTICRERNCGFLIAINESYMMDAQGRFICYTCLDARPIFLGTEMKCPIGHYDSEPEDPTIREEIRGLEYLRISVNVIHEPSTYLSLSMRENINSDRELRGFRQIWRQHLGKKDPDTGRYVEHDCFLCADNIVEGTSYWENAQGNSICGNCVKERYTLMGPPQNK